MRICDKGENRFVKNLICGAFVGRQYSMQRFLNSRSVLYTATEARFGKGSKFSKWQKDYCSFAKISENNKGWCNERSKLLTYKKVSPTAPLPTKIKSAPVFTGANSSSH